MISLIQLLKEIQSGPKAVIMAGSAGVGKSTFTKQIQSELDKNNWEVLNPDSYIEGKKSFPDDFVYDKGNKKGQKREINLSNASIFIKDKYLPSLTSSQQNFLYDTTAVDVENIKNIITNPSYKGNVKMVMVYAHPIVSFLRNFSRPERMVPALGVLKSWNNTYKTIDNYVSLLGDNFYLAQTGVSPEEQKQIDSFNKAYQNGQLKEYFQDLLSKGNFTSTFRKDPTKPRTPEEIKITKEKFGEQIDELSNQFEIVQNNIQQVPNQDKNYNDVVNIIKRFINE